MSSSARFSDAVLRDRLAAAADSAAEHGTDALLVTPSPDFGYLLGYRPPALERLTCLVVPTAGRPTLIVPRLEEPLARHELGDLVEAVELRVWDETDDPFVLVATLLDGARVAAVQDQMWARFVLRLRAALGGTELVEAGSVLGRLRSVKDAEEIGRLRAAAHAADEAMLAITGERLSGRTEREVSDRIRALLLDAGLQLAEFAIVASGPNAASPHHEPGERRIARGDAIVLDIGGSLAGYAADTSRTAFVGDPPPAFSELFAVLREAQAAACDAVRPGVAAEAIDAAARSLIAGAGYADAFIHRTGHGIGLETHEEPYIVAGNSQPIEAGHAFSVEPGIYVEGRWGARIEDIVVCTPEGGERLNTTPRELYLVQ